jgi:hypothetical protein
VFLVPTGSAEDASIEPPPETEGGVLHTPDAHMVPPEDSGQTLHPRGRDAGDSGPRCETNRYPEVSQPLGVYLMVDQSVPMRPAWNSVVTALKDFITESGQLTDVSMGIQYFAISPTSPTQEFADWQRLECDALTYATPDVPIKPLPGNQQALFTSLGAHNPSKVWPNLPLGIFDSPYNLSLSGAITGLRNWSANVKQPKLAVVLVTDGQLNLSCPGSSAETQQIAKEGVSGPPSVVTYVLGVGGLIDALNGIATAGGTDHAYLAASTAAPADILTQLKSIRDVALPCEISVDQAHLQQGDVNVELETGGKSETLTRVDTASDCTSDTTPKQWFAEKPDAGGKVALCPAACTSIRSIKNATLDVVYGCPTVFAK